MRLGLIIFTGKGKTSASPNSAHEKFPNLGNWFIDICWKIRQQLQGDIRSIHWGIEIPNFRHSGRIGN